MISVSERTAERISKPLECRLNAMHMDGEITSRQLAIGGMRLIGNLQNRQVPAVVFHALGKPEEGELLDLWVECSIWTVPIEFCLEADDMRMLLAAAKAKESGGAA